MADAYTGTPSVAWDQAAWDRLAYFAFQPELMFDQIADVRPTSQSMPGATVTFTQVGDLTPTSTPLSETIDVDAEAMTDAQVSLTLAEYGKATITTARLRATSFLPVNAIQARLIGNNAGRSLNEIAANALKVGTNVTYAAGANRAGVTTGSRLTAALVRRQYVKLENKNTPKIGGKYMSVVHPDTKLDLREETGMAAWRDPHVYSKPDEIWNNELGEFEGFRFVVTTDAPKFVDAGVGGTVDVYRSLFLGQEALAKTFATQDGYGERPTIVPGPITDKLRRFVPLGWKWMGAFGIFRQDSIVAVEHATSIAG